MSKGSVRRNGNSAKFDENFDRIFGGHKQSKGGSFVQDPSTGELIDRDLLECRPRVNAPMVMKPLEAFQSPIDRSVIRTREQLKVHNKRHGVTNVRDYKDGYVEKKAHKRVNDGQNYLNKTRRVDINSAIDKHS